MSRWTRRFLLAGTLLTSAALAVSCTGSDSRARSGSSTPSSTSTSTSSLTKGYLAVTSSELVFFEWAESGQELSGAYNALRTSSTHQAVPEMRILTGERSGDTVSLSVSGAPPWTGRIHDKMLTVVIPQPGGATKSVELTAATHADYERAARAFRDELSGAAR